MSTPCPKCNDTGLTDSGGFYPWGESILVNCDCELDKLVRNPTGGVANGNGWNPCCNKEKRNRNGGCDSCGDPCF